MSDWPALSVEADHETLAVLHLASQMIGKIRVAHAPWVNHGWHTALQPNARGLAALPTAASGDAASIVSERAPDAAVAETVGRLVALLGDVEFPLHACHIAPAATNDAA